MFGWVQGSDVSARYVHLSGGDIDNAYDQVHGLYDPDEDEYTPDVIEYPRGEELNDPETAADVEEQIGEDVKTDCRETDPDEEETNRQIDLIDKVLDDPDVKQLIAEKLQE